MPRYIHVLRCRWPVVGRYCRQTVGCLMTNDGGSLSFERPTPGVISVISRPRDLEKCLRIDGLIVADTVH